MDVRNHTARLRNQSRLIVNSPAAQAPEEIAAYETEEGYIAIPYLGTFSTQTIMYGGGAVGVLLLLMLVTGGGDDGAPTVNIS